MITLLTDFGTKDYFVPAVKGVILSLCPTANIIDLTHDIPAQDVMSAAFTLGACYRNFPVGTIHLAVVDPGVGSARRVLIVEASGHYFVGPDNGIFSFVYAQENDWRAFHAHIEEFFRPHPSATFHGRDIFAPVAAWLANGVTPDSLGREITDVVRHLLPVPQRTEAGILGEILQIDHFGNCITNLRARDFDWEKISAKTYFEIAGTAVRQFCTHYAQAQNPAEPIAYLGSAGFWEIALVQDSAAALFQVQRGDAVKVFY